MSILLWEEMHCNWKACAFGVMQLIEEARIQHQKLSGDTCLQVFVQIFNATFFVDVAQAVNQKRNS